MRKIKCDLALTSVVIFYSILFLAGAALAGTPSVSHADSNAEGIASSSYDKCRNEHSDNIGWARCGQEEIKRQELLLANAWADLYKNLKKEYPTAAAYMLNEQRSWIKWKDVACEHWHDAIGMGMTFGREADVLTYPSCKISLISQRISELTYINERIEFAMPW